MADPVPTEPPAPPVAVEAAFGPLGAWQPLTFRGVARFAQATTPRLWLVQLTFAMLTAMSVVIFLNQAWFPIVSAAIHALPEEGEIENARFAWEGEAPVVLAENRFLSIVVDPEDARQLGNISDVQLTFLHDRLRVSSLASSLVGHWFLPYDAEQPFPFNRPELEPWWGAWNSLFYGAAVLVTLISLYVSWFVLAVLYAPVARIVAFFGDRAVTLIGCWRLAGAALMPGALLMSGAVILHSAQQVTLVHVGFALVLHMLLGWIYLIAATLRLPGVETLPPVVENPFQPVPDNVEKK